MQNNEEPRVSIGVNRHNREIRQEAERRRRYKFYGPIAVLLIVVIIICALLSDWVYHTNDRDLKSGRIKHAMHVTIRGDSRDKCLNSQLGKVSCGHKTLTNQWVWDQNKKEIWHSKHGTNLCQFNPRSKKLVLRTHKHVHYQLCQWDAVELDDYHIEIFLSNLPLSKIRVSSPELPPKYLLNVEHASRPDGKTLRESRTIMDSKFELQVVEDVPTAAVWYIEQSETADSDFVRLYVGNKKYLAIQKNPFGLILWDSHRTMIEGIDMNWKILTDGQDIEIGQIQHYNIPVNAHFPQTMSLLIMSRLNFNSDTAQWDLQPIESVNDHKILSPNWVPPQGRMDLRGVNIVWYDEEISDPSDLGLMLVVPWEDAVTSPSDPDGEEVGAAAAAAGEHGTHALVIEPQMRKWGDYGAKHRLFDLECEHTNAQYSSMCRVKHQQSGLYITAINQASVEMSHLDVHPEKCYFWFFREAKLREPGKATKVMIWKKMPLRLVKVTMYKQKIGKRADFAMTPTMANDIGDGTNLLALVDPDFDDEHINWDTDEVESINQGATRVG